MTPAKTATAEIVDMVYERIYDYAATGTESDARAVDSAVEAIISRAIESSQRPYVEWLKEIEGLSGLDNEVVKSSIVIADRLATIHQIAGAAVADADDSK